MSYIINDFNFDLYTEDKDLFSCDQTIDLFFEDQEIENTLKQDSLEINEFTFINEQKDSIYINETTPASTPASRISHSSTLSSESLGTDDESIQSCTKSPESPNSCKSMESSLSRITFDAKIAQKRELEIDSICSTSSDSDESKSELSENKAVKKRKRSNTGAEGDKVKRRREANRISAAASRERKKMYVKELEARVKEMESEHASIVQNMTVTQMENVRLRSLIEQLTRNSMAQSYPTSNTPNTNNVSSSSNMEIIENLEPSHKRRRLEASTTPVVNLSSIEEPVKLLEEENPFSISFWDKVPGKAVMFAMVFCIAMFVGFSGQKSDLFYGGKAKQSSSPVRVGRRILTSGLEDYSINPMNSINIKPNQKQFRFLQNTILGSAHNYISSIFDKRDDVNQYAPTHEIAHAEF